MVQVEVNSFSPPSLSLLLTAAQVKWCGLEQEMGSRRAAFGCLLAFGGFFHTIPTSCTSPSFFTLYKKNNNNNSVAPNWANKQCLTNEN